MLRIAVQVSQLISSNVPSTVDSTSNPMKVLRRFQREVEQAIISLEGERTLTEQRKVRLERKFTQQSLRAEEWTDKAKIAMDHDREDLARQALVAREDCRNQVTSLESEIAEAKSDLEEIENALVELEAKREEVAAKAKQQSAAEQDRAPTCADTSVSKADRYRSRIAQMEKRTDFATEDSSTQREHAAVDKEIDEMRRASVIDAEIASMKDQTGEKTAGSKKAPARKPAAKKRSTKRAA